MINSKKLNDCFNFLKGLTNRFMHINISKHILIIASISFFFIKMIECIKNAILVENCFENKH